MRISFLLNYKKKNNLLLNVSQQVTEKSFFLEYFRDLLAIYKHF